MTKYKYNVEFSSSFKKNLKKITKQGKDIETATKYLNDYKSIMVGTKFYFNLEKTNFSRKQNSILVNFSYYNILYN